MAKYSNARAMRSLIKASLQAIVKSPSAIIFTIAFPLIFILVFGFLGEGGGFTIKVANAPGADTTSRLYSILHMAPVLKWVRKDSATTVKMLTQGDIVATIEIHKQPEGSKPEYEIMLNAASTEIDKAQQLKNIIGSIVEKQDPEIQKRQEEMVRVNMHIAAVRDYKTIDFILPGQLSFSLLASGVFGTAFVFFNLRQTLVLKRFFATPVRKEIIVLSEGIARMLFQLVGAIIIISVGYFAFGYTLYNGWVTFLEMLFVCSLALLIFMGFGFIISGVAKSESAIPPLSNLITLPQFLLAGTFFSVDAFPKWLQPFCKSLPLTYLNDALRKIAFEGVGLWAVRTDILVLLVWGVVIYAIAGKTFKWE
ncbi:MAG: transporter permease [Flavipsychrobacter sp.]|nr:transporter permease [Flavipsychrobacter sp.]